MIGFHHLVEKLPLRKNDQQYQQQQQQEHHRCNWKNMKICLEYLHWMLFDDVMKCIKVVTISEAITKLNGQSFM